VNLLQREDLVREAQICLALLGSRALSRKEVERLFQGVRTIIEEGDDFPEVLQEMLRAACYSNYYRALGHFLSHHTLGVIRWEYRLLWVNLHFLEPEDFIHMVDEHIGRDGHSTELEIIEYLGRCYYSSDEYQSDYRCRDLNC